jgi:hypothetical protein
MIDRIHLQDIYRVLVVVGEVGAASSRLVLLQIIHKYDQPILDNYNSFSPSSTPRYK